MRRPGPSCESVNQIRAIRMLCRLTLSATLIVLSFDERPDLKVMSFSSERNVRGKLQSMTRRRSPIVFSQEAGHAFQRFEHAPRYGFARFPGFSRHKKIRFDALSATPDYARAALRSNGRR
jgi:hypothetical protein